MRYSLLAACLLVAVACSPGTSTDDLNSESWAPAPRQTRIPVGDAGALSFLVPQGWEYKYKQSAVEKIRAIHVRFRKDDHYVQITGALTGFDGKDKVAWSRKAAQSAGSERLSGAVESSLVVEDMAGAQTQGAYFTLTDKSLAGVSDPPPGDYRVMTQGAVAVGDVAVAFTILGNDRDSALRRDALKMLTNATYKPAR